MKFRRSINAPARLALVVLFACVAFASSAPGPLKICLLSASAEYESDKSLREFQSFLEQGARIECQRAFGSDKGAGLPGLEALNVADLLIVFTRRVTLPPAQLALLKKYLAAGKPVIGLRTASHGFQNYPEFDREILGGGYKGHHPNSEVAVRIAAGRSAHPLLSGVADFTSRKLYRNPTLADDVVVLLEGTTTAGREPLAWVRERNGGRVFYTSLGTPEDFRQESFRRLLVNAVFWTTRHDPAAFRKATALTNGAPSSSP